MFTTRTGRRYRLRMRRRALREYLEALAITALFTLPMFADAIWWRP